MKRRDFIRQSGLATGMLFVPSFLKPFELSRPLPGKKRLIVIQLSGGNDWLNTIVPYTNDIYYQHRPVLGIPKDEVIRLSDELGFNPAIQALREVYDQGWMSIINNVGYPNPDRSHFRSLDIWHTASGSNENLSTGWIGRYLDSNCSGCEKVYQAIEVDDTLSLAMKGQNKRGMAVKDAKQLYDTTRDPFFKNVISRMNNFHLNDDNLGYLYKTMTETASSAEYIYETSKTYTNLTDYPQSEFARQLKTISTFINSGLPTQVYYVSLSGFDTHIGQKGRQEKLLKIYAEAVSSFICDLKINDNWRDTLIMTFSEFGRRVEQNASSGTDHGTAGNVFVFSGSLEKKGFFNASPDLSDLDEGDLKYRIDFRNVYATIMDKWLGVESGNLLGQNFDKMNFI